MKARSQGVAEERRRYSPGGSWKIDGVSKVVACIGVLSAWEAGTRRRVDERAPLRLSSFLEEARHAFYQFFPPLSRRCMVHPVPPKFS